MFCFKNTTLLSWIHHLTTEMHTLPKVTTILFNYTFLPSYFVFMEMNDPLDENRSNTISIDSSAPYTCI